jgi:hypothetical protein
MKLSDEVLAFSVVHLISFTVQKLKSIENFELCVTSDNAR